MSSEDFIREASDPATSPGRLAELAGADRNTWAAIASNPAAYDGLLTWLSERSDPAVDAALAARAEAAAQAAAQAALPPIPAPAPVAPPAPPAPPAPEPVAFEQPQPVAPEPVAPEPVAPEPVAAAPEPTVVVPTQPVYPEHPTYPAQSAPEATSVFAAAPAATTSAFSAVPPAGTDTDTQDADGTGGSGKNLAIVIAMVAVVLALIAGAAFGATQVFGGDDDDKPSITATDDKETDEPTDEPSDEPSEEPSDDVIPTIPEPDALGGDSDSSASPEFCSTMKEIETASMDLLDTGGATPDLDSIKDLAEDMQEAYGKLGDSAPAELKSDIQVMADYFDILSDPTGDSASKMSESISAYSKAAQKVGVYYAQNCL